MVIHLKQFTKFPNAGDVASGRIVARLLNSSIKLCGETPLSHSNLIAIGSILHWADENSVIWGSGFISSTSALTARPAKFTAVRGHLTRTRLEELGIPGPKVVGDPGIFVRDLFPPTAVRQRIGVIPHYADADHSFVCAAQDRGALIISPLLPLDEYLAALTSCMAVVSSSLHGIVFAHAYQIPAAWVILSNRVIGDGFKFRDYYSSIGLEPREIPNLNHSTSLEEAIDRAALPRLPIDKDGLRDALLEARNLVIGEAA